MASAFPNERRMSSRSACVAAAAVGLLLPAALFVESAALGQCLPGTCGFTESGKKGRFLDRRVDAADLARADAAIAGGSGGEGLLAAQSVNRGQLFGTGLRMPETERRLGELLTQLRPHWKHRPVAPVRVRIVGTNSFIPQSFADNVIVVPFGVLARARSDGQVAWLVAHEFSHIALGHFAREARAKKRSRSIGQIMGAIDTLTLLSQHRVAANGGTIRLYEVTDKQTLALGDAIWARSRQLEGALALYGAFFKRSDEDQADVAGLDLAVAAGFAQGGAIDALEVIRQDQEQQASLFDEIAGALTSYGEKTGMATLRSVDQSTNLIGLAVNWVKDFAANALVVALGKTKKAYLAAHRPPGKRMEGVRDYYRRAYEGEAERPISRTWLAGVQATGEFAEATQTVNAYTKALASVGAQNVAQAQLELRPALGTRYASTPMIRNLQARIAEMQGDLRGADRAYSLAARLPAEAAAPARAPARRGTRGRQPAAKPAATPALSGDPYLEQSLDGFRDHVSLLVKMGNYAKALAVIAEAKRRFNDDQAFLPNYVAIYSATRQTELLVMTLNRCSDVADPGIEQGCRGAMLTDSQQRRFDQLSPADQAKIQTALARTSSRARGRGLLARINDELNPDEED
jgi:hypothetical protein